MFSIFFHEKYIYQYPFSKDQLKEDLNNYFVKSRKYNFNVKNDLDKENTFTISYLRRSTAEIKAKVTPSENGLCIHMEIGISPLFYLILTLIILLLFSPDRFDMFIIITLVTLLFLVIEYYVVRDLKREFEERLGLPYNDDVIGKKFRWY
jgi:hypothetical protein